MNMTTHAVKHLPSVNPVDALVNFSRYLVLFIIVGLVLTLFFLFVSRLFFIAFIVLILLTS
jgi:hypothetical protein